MITRSLLSGHRKPSCVRYVAVDSGVKATLKLTGLCRPSGLPGILARPQFGRALAEAEQGVSIMLRSIESLYGNPVIARDGEIGSVDEVYFDDEAWGVRYLIVETGHWFDRDRVLISPYSFEPTGPDAGTIKVNLTRQQVKDSPGIDTHRPVSRQHEIDYLGYYGYPVYWGGAYVWGMGANPAFGSMSAAPGVEIDARMRRLEQEEDARTEDTHLRSTGAIKGYGIEAADGGIGHVYGFVFDDAAWVIRYLIVDTRNWWPGGKEVLIATCWLNHIDWINRLCRRR
jgi:sporulation protein YlmC with PRC-barrel domain